MIKKERRSIERIVQMVLQLSLYDNIMYMYISFDVEVFPFLKTRFKENNGSYVVVM